MRCVETASKGRAPSQAFSRQGEAPNVAIPSLIPAAAGANRATLDVGLMLTVTGAINLYLGPTMGVCPKCG
jgi:hypothetical protein